MDGSPSLSIKIDYNPPKTEKEGGPPIPFLFSLYISSFNIFIFSFFFPLSYFAHSTKFFFMFILLFFFLLIETTTISTNLSISFCIFIVNNYLQIKLSFSLRGTKKGDI